MVVNDVTPSCIDAANCFAGTLTSALPLAMFRHIEYVARTPGGGWRSWRADGGWFWSCWPAASVAA